MCGIFGIRGTGDAARLTQTGLYSLQHRGQESAGVAVIDGDRAHVARVMGTVSESLGRELVGATGNVAIGHTRYSTAGSSTIENAQPIVVRSRGGCIALAHNGNLVNAIQVRTALEAEGSIFSTSADSEVIVHRLARSHASSPAARMAEALTGLEGAYSLVAVIGDTLIAARDPRGWRPLVMGRVNGAVVFASETCALDIVGATLVRELLPGEMAILDASGYRVEQAVPPRQHDSALCIFEFIYFARPDSRMDGQGLMAARYRMGERLAYEAPAAADVVISVPDSGTPAAQGYANRSGLPFADGLVKSRYVGRTFIQPDQRLREHGLRLKFNPVPDLIRGRRVVVVDDSIVRGSTTRKIVAMLRAAGAAEVHLRISSPPIVSPCYYGIDMAAREELLASNRSLDEIRQALGADSLAYLSLEGLQQATGLEADHFCRACLTGEYPTTVPEVAAADKARFERSRLPIQA
jgi:amidophosphoribosyltransferase